MSARSGLLLLTGLLLCGNTPLRADEPPRLDSLGDPLPNGAVVRLGSLRLRQERFHALSYSRDGAMLAGVSSGEPVRVWDVKTGRSIVVCGSGSPRQLCLAFAPDGRTLASAVNDTAVRFWDVATGKQIKHLDDHGSGVSGVAFSADGRTFASASYDKMIRLWDSASGKLLHKLEGHTEAASCVVFADDRIISGGEDAIIRLWGVKTGEVLAELRGHTAEVRALAVSADAGILASAGWDGSVRIWDLDRQKLLHKCAGHTTTAAAIAWLKDGKTVVSGGWDGTLLWWEAATGKLLRSTRVRGDAQVYALTVSPDGKTLVSAGALAAPQFWDVATGKEIDPFPGHHGYISRVAFAADGKTIVSHGRDRSLHWWEASSGHLLRRQAEPLSADTREPRFAILSPAGSFWAQVSPTNEVHVGAADGKLDRKPSGEPADHPDSTESLGRVSALAFSPDERRLAIGYAEGGIGVWRLFRGKPLPQCGQRGNFIKGLTFSSDSRMLASLQGGERVCRLWEIATGKLRAEIEDVAGQSVILSADGRSLALWTARARSAPTITVIDTAAGKARCECRGKRADEQFTEAVFSPDGRELAAGTSDGLVLVWDTATGSLLHSFESSPPFQGSKNEVLALAFSPDGRRLVSGNSDTTAMVWAVPAPTPLKGAPAPSLTDKDLEALWSELGADDAAAAWKAIGQLAAAPEQALPFLAEKMRPRPFDPKRIDQLIADLDSSTFEVRQQATVALERLGPAAEVALEKRLSGKPPPEVTKRLQRLLDRIAAESLSPETLRVWRGMEMLEQSGSAAARPILEKIAHDSPVVALVEEAKATMARMK